MKIATKIEGEDIVYKYLWNVVDRQLEAAERNKKGSIYDHVTAMIFSFLTFEAYLNFIGERLAPDVWKNEQDFFRREPYRGFSGKLKKVIELVGMDEPDYTQRPYSTLRMLKKLRDSIVHAKTTKIRTEVEHDGDARPELEYPMFGGLVSRGNAAHASEDVKQCVESIHAAARTKLPHDYWLGQSAFGGITYHATGQSRVIEN